ncbi:MAG: type II secretion system protein [Burkholderiaceae bacterium]|nr:MAG: type II secretion system protein [Burkholderiaceae bacterium]
MSAWTMAHRRTDMSRRKAFTLIELLVVIAIIGTSHLAS